MKFLTYSEYIKKYNVNYKRLERAIKIGLVVSRKTTDGRRLIHDEPIRQRNWLPLSQYLKKYNLTKDVVAHCIFKGYLSKFKIPKRNGKPIGIFAHTKQNFLIEDSFPRCEGLKKEFLLQIARCNNGN